MSKTNTHGLFLGRVLHVLPVDGDGSDKKGLDNIVRAARSSAPYLDRLCVRWPNIIHDLSEHSPEKICANLNVNIETSSYDNLCKSLRQVKEQLHLLTALCDLAGVWSWEQVTETLSDFTDIAMQALIKSVAVEMKFEGNERGPVPGLFVLALGKYGGRELNYSSDIDLIVFYDPDHIQLPNPNNAQRILVRFVKKLMRGFDEVTADGYVFRTDLRLRPDPRANAVAVSTLTAERYYETLGQNWERAAMIKARYCGGDKLSCEAFIDTVLRPFIWRRSLDYAAIADIHSIKRQIQGNAALEHLTAPGHDIKLGLGGIREIEFYAQIQQLILGGRNKALRVTKTVEVLAALGAGNYTQPEIVKTMIADYAYLRNLEHRAQMYEDKQTHIWPTEESQRVQLMHLSGGDNLVNFERELVNLFSRIHRIYTQLFSDEEDLSVSKGSLVFTGVEAEQPTLETLNAYGFLRGKTVWAEITKWLGGRIRATRSQRARELLTRLAPRIIEACGQQNSPDDAFVNFSVFFENLNAGVSMLSLFVSKPDTLKSLMDILAIAPRLAYSLSDQPALIDAMVEPDFLNQKIDISTIQYTSLLSRDCDFEAAMDIVRRAVREDQFNLTTSILRLQHIDKAGDIFSAIAQAAINALLPKAVQETERIYGPLYGEYAVLALGKLGSGEMSIGSDLDIMLVYDPAKNDSLSSDIVANQTDQFNKLTRRLISSLSSVTSEGGLYEVDMALRPSGRSGPLAVSLQAFESYYTDKAWTWEYMALCRARVIAASSDSFIKSVNGHVQKALAQKHFAGNLTKDVLEMHERLQKEKPAKGEWDIKGVKGGLRDIEFITQFLMLKHKPFLRENTGQSLHDMLELAQHEKWILCEDAQILLKISSYYQGLLQMKSIAIEDAYCTADLPASVKLLMAKCVKLDNFILLERKYAFWRQQVFDLFTKVIV